MEIPVGTSVALRCQRIDCAAVEFLEVGEIEPDAPLIDLADAIRDEWPEDWGWDMAGVNRVLHCPEHRDSAKHELES